MIYTVLVRNKEGVSDKVSNRKDGMNNVDHCMDFYGYSNFGFRVTFR